MTPLSIATTGVPGDLPSKIEAIAAAGFAGMELCEPDLVGFPGNAEDVGAKAKALGLAIEVVQPLLNFEGLSGAERQAAYSKLDQMLGQMPALGARTLLVGTNARDDASGDRNAIAADLRQLARRAEKAGCRAALLALPWARHITNELKALEFIEAVDSPHLGLALNSHFTIAAGGQAKRLRGIPGERVFHVQLSDAPAPVFDITLSKNQSGLLPGQGVLNLANFVRVVARLGYEGPWSISLTGATAEGGRDNHARDGYRALVSLLDEVAQTEPALPRPAPDLPPRVHPTGFEFVEFAVDDACRERLTGLLRTLCFRKERRHVSRAVELWRQGAVNIVVNSETVGFAAEAFAEHGPCVCDMGIRVKDADQTVGRATRLGAPEFSQPVGTGELDIPAIKGVGGSVVHFIDEKSDLHRVWDIEFDPVSKSEAAQPAGLRRIDHVAQTMRYEEMQSWLTYYLSTFEMEKVPVVDVADPSGVILSQALASPEGEVRLNLNGAGGQRTFAGSFLAQRFGAGVQHLAFLSDDIFETSNQLAVAGFKRLAIARNYYDDLKVRFGLGNEMAGRLRAAHILYDRDGQGEYFQIYSTPIWGGFFFEIVQRKGCYQGYGARNAPIRLAAQVQLLKDTETT